VRGLQVDFPRIDHLGYRVAVRAHQDHASGMDDRVFVDDCGDLQLFGFILGLWAKGWEQLQFIPMLVITLSPSLGAPSTRSACCAGVADVQPVQSHRLSHQRLSLVLLRHSRRQCRHQLLHDRRIFRAVPGGDFMDFSRRDTHQELRHASRADEKIRYERPDHHRCCDELSGCCAMSGSSRTASPYVNDRRYRQTDQHRNIPPPTPQRPGPRRCRAEKWNHRTNPTPYANRPRQFTGIHAVAFGNRT